MARPNKFDGLLNDLCVGWGFCGCVDSAGKPKHVAMMIPENGLVSAEQFSEWAIRAEWPDDDYDDPSYQDFRQTWLDKITQRFVKHMGADAVDAESLRSEWSGLHRVGRIE